jgi:hypothetical protein
MFQGEHQSFCIVNIRFRAFHFAPIRFCSHFVPLLTWRPRAKHEYRFTHRSSTRLMVWIV